MEIVYFIFDCLLVGLSWCGDGNKNICLGVVWAEPNFCLEK